MRVLVLVLASDTDPLYCAFQSAWREIAPHPDADVFFVKAHPNLVSEGFIHKDTIFVRCEESLDAVYQKQLICFRVLRPYLAVYTYVFRTNLSSFLDIPAYLRFCQRLPKTGVYSGVLGQHGTILYASGCGFTITPDLIYRLLDETPPEVLVDDVSIGSAITAWGVPIIPAPRIDATPSGPIVHTSPLSSEVFHRRFKTENRMQDVELVTKMFKNREPVVIRKPLANTPFRVRL